MLFCFRSIQNDFKILSAPRDRNHPAPTWSQTKHCISRRKERKYHFKCELLVSKTSLCTQQQRNSLQGLANQHCKYTAPPEGTDCHSMDERGRRHHEAAVELMPAWHLALPLPVSQNTQSWTQGCRWSPWPCLLCDCSVLPKLHPHTHSSQQPELQSWFWTGSSSPLQEGLAKGTSIKSLKFVERERLCKCWTAKY